ncbi:DUF4144 family protein [Thalassotalea sp. Y01]|uniref:DUF4144 family protein n=1 Tax=Thalassotalea sp. Y01 TaxID=2729613 RepID=UPI00145FB93A|nr:DUF4144 family protein [Thalassotalea sp. Y01]NMP16103.1 hypothetical protein [Thalassotalea sp. Y01]
MIHWPALIKHDGEDELIFIENRDAWRNDEEMLLYLFTESDVLVDSTGQIFSLPDLQNNLDSEQVLGQASLDNVIELVANHAVVCNICCAEKINAKNILEAVELVASMKD